METKGPKPECNEPVLEVIPQLNMYDSTLLIAVVNKNIKPNLQVWDNVTTEVG
jgi:hypothetical protein